MSEQIKTSNAAEATKLHFPAVLLDIAKKRQKLTIKTLICSIIKSRLTFFNSLQLSIYQYITINFNLYTIKLLLYQIIFVYLHII